jgi:hypothetical protein
LRYADVAATLVCKFIPVTNERSDGLRYADVAATLVCKFIPVTDEESDGLRCADVAATLVIRLPRRINGYPFGLLFPSGSFGRCMEFSTGV